jgi:hypothetical protein
MIGRRCKTIFTADALKVSYQTPERPALGRGAYSSLSTLRGFHRASLSCRPVTASRGHRDRHGAHIHREPGSLGHEADRLTFWAKVSSFNQ